MTQLIHLLGTLAVGVVVLNLLFYTAQSGIVFYPSTQLYAVPSDLGMEFEDVGLQTEDGIALHGWYIPAPGARKTLLFLHGNAGNISHRGDSIRIFHDLGLNVFIFDYRGYGRSKGHPSEAGLYRDAWSAWSYLTQQRGAHADDILIFGRSLGGAVAAELAARVRPAGVIIESGFSSAADASRLIHPLLSRIVLLRYRFPAADHLAKASAPVLVLHSPDDQLLPIELGRRLFERAPEPKRFVALSGGHNDGFLQSMPGYARELERFLTQDVTAAPEAMPE